MNKALESGNSSYNPLGAITLYYASARNQITVNSNVVPQILGVINPLLSKAGAGNTAKFLGSSLNNTAALVAATKCPQCLAGPFAINSVDLIPFNSSVAMGSTMVGLIFVSQVVKKNLSSDLNSFQLLTFTFTIFQILHVAATIIGPALKLSSTLIFRITASLTSYLWLSLTYTLVNYAFGVPMDRVYGHGGFVVYWMLNWCTMGAGQ